MANIGSILVDGQDVDMPALRAWLANLAGTVSAAAMGFRTFDTEAALNEYTPTGDQPRYAFVADGDAFTGYRFTGSLPWVEDATFYEGVATVVQPLVDQVTEVAEQVETFTTGNRVLFGSPGYAQTGSSGGRNFLINGETIDHPEIVRMNAAIETAGLSKLFGPVSEIDVSPLGSLVAGMVYGQSTDGDGPDNVYLNIQTGPFDFAKMYTPGPRPQDGGTDPAVIYASAVPYGENGGRETPMGAALKMIAQLRRDWDGVEMGAASGEYLFGSVPGAGGQSSASLADPTENPGTNYLYNRMIDNISHGPSVAASLGLAYQLTFAATSQGEGDYSANLNPETEWKPNWRKTRLGMQAAALAATGINRPLPMIVEQTATHLYYGRNTPTIALAQLAICQSDDMFVFAGPTYDVSYQNEGEQPRRLHPDAQGLNIKGARYGLAAYLWLYRGIKMRPFIPDTVVRSGSSVIARWDTGGRKLVLDQAIPNPTGTYGFTLATSGGADIPITGVKLVGRDRVVITTGSAVPAGFKLRNGWTGDAFRGLSSVRDDLGDDLIFDPDGPMPVPMHRWAPIFEIAGA